MSAPAARMGDRRSAKGVHHWWVQRITAVALIPLGVWFLVSILALPAHDYTTVVSWLGERWTAALLALFIAVSAWHSHLGVQVVVEDYLRGAAKTFSMTLSTLAHIFIAVAAILAVLRVGFGGFA